jgi:hypothetical protein
VDDKEGDLSPALLSLSLRETEMSRDVSASTQPAVQDRQRQCDRHSHGIDNCQLNFRYTDAGGIFYHTPEPHQAVPVHVSEKGFLRTDHPGSQVCLSLCYRLSAVHSIGDPKP